LDDAELPVHDTIPGEDAIFYDMEDPPMDVGTRYSSMKEFRAAVSSETSCYQREI